MSIPGSDILEDALSVIESQAITYYKFLSRNLNDVGQDIAIYDDPISIYGSFQTIPRNLYQQLGLDYNKSYFNLYVSNNVIDIERDVSGDQVIFQTIKYQCEAVTEWFRVDGWVAIRCVGILDFES